MWALTHDKIDKINGLPILCWTYLEEVVFENSPRDHEQRSIRCHVGVHHQPSYNIVAQPTNMASKSRLKRNLRIHRGP